MTLLLQQNLGTAWGVNTAAPVVVRRGKPARGRARLRGRRLWWMIVALAPQWWG